MENLILNCQVVGYALLLLFQFDTIQLSKARLLMFKKGIMIVERQVDIYIVIVMAS